MTHKISKLAQVVITVAAVEPAFRLYRDTLGLTFLFSPAENMAFLQCGSTRIMLSIPRGARER